MEPLGCTLTSLTTIGAEGMNEATGAVCAALAASGAEIAIDVAKIALEMTEVFMVFFLPGLSG